MAHPVIVGVDDLHRAEDSVALGRVLAPALGAKLLLAHVYRYDQRRVRYLDDGFEEQLRADAQRMRSLSEKSGPRARLVSVNDTSPARGLHRHRPADGACCAVRGRRGTSRIRRNRPGDRQDRRRVRR